MRHARIACALALHIAAVPAPALAADDFSARLSSASAAMEYWDVTSWFTTGERFSARFLITNEGPGTRTAAAVGHLLLPSGEMVAISYGRLSDRWTLSDDRRRLKIASAVLNMTGSTFRVEVDSDKRGIKLAIDIPAAPPVTLTPIADVYAVDALMPRRATGTYLLRGMTKPHTIDGIAALTHTSMEASEADLVVQRAEMFSRIDDTAIYVNAVTLAAGGQRRVIVRQRGQDARVINEPVLRYDDWRKVGHPDYVIPLGWNFTDAGLRATLKREYLRWDPLEILPQPFRFLVSLQGAPRRIWSDADITLAGADDTPPTKGTGVSVVTFAKPGTLQ